MDSPSDVAVTCFATHGSLGVVDLGATKTVIGSDNVQELLDNLKPQIKKSIYRCPCKITFRFGNHGILQSEVALVVPIHGFHLKIAIVPGSTPFLLSNTLLRALESIIDTQKKVLYSKKVDMSFPLQLTSKGLFLLDLNDLASDKPSLTPNECIAETNVVVEPKPGHSFTQQVATTQGDVREELPTVIINQESSKETPERSIGWKKLSKGNMKSEENNPPSSQVQGDTQFARSFQFLDRSLRHVAGQPPPEDSSQGERAPAGLLQNVSGYQETITFGQAHKGHTYQEVWHQDQAWVLWFTQHYGNSKKGSHRQFLHYVELMIERAELEEEKVPIVEPNKTPPSSSVAAGKPYPKAKGAPKASDLAAELEEEIDTQSQFDMVEFMPEPVRANIGHLETRMLNLENALTRVTMAHQSEGSKTSP